MARIQILPLPAERVGEYERIPYILILDQIDDEAWTPDSLEHLKHQTSAVTVIGYQGTLDAPGALELTEQQQADMIDFLTKPMRWVTGQASTATLAVDHAARAIAATKSGGV